MKDTNVVPFEDRIGQFEKEIRLHCYRLTGSLLDSEDMLQESLIKAWKSQSSLREDAKLRSWLYRIATNVCLDYLKAQKRRALPQAFFAAADPKRNLPSPNPEIPWLEPFPNVLLPDRGGNPEEALIEQEDLSIAFLTSIQLLPAQQRAALILIEVLDWSPKETAEALGNSLSSINSLLYRARKSLREQGNTFPRALEDEKERVLLRKFLDAWERSDIKGLGQLLKEDAIFQMPPFPSWYKGREKILEMVQLFLFDSSQRTRWKLARFDANNQPSFLLSRLDEKSEFYELFGLMMISIVGGRVAEIVAFLSNDLFSFYAD